MKKDLPIWLSMNIRVCGRQLYINHFQGVSPDVEIKQLEWDSLLKHERLEIIRRLHSFLETLVASQNQGDD